jgi:hypothetical protein
VTLNGSLTFTQPQLVLQVGPAVFGMQRALNWTYDAARSVFLAPVKMSGTMRVVVPAGSGGGASGTGVLALVTAAVTLSSAGYPGERLQRMLLVGLRCGLPQTHAVCQLADSASQ